jgi:hypothetical protein
MSTDRKEFNLTTNMDYSLSESQEKKYEYCLEMLRRFASSFESDTVEWIKFNDDLVKEVLIGHLDRLTAAQRIDVYRTLFGFFRKHYSQVMDIRLQAERNPKCLQELKAIEKLHQEEIQKPYMPVTDADLLGSSENNLKSNEASIRYLGALGVWVLTEDSKKVVPTLLAILKDRDGKARNEATKLLGEIHPLNEDAIQTLREIRDDVHDPVRLMAADALKKQSSLNSTRQP